MSEMTVKWRHLRSGAYQSADGTALMLRRRPWRDKPERWVITYRDWDGSRITREFATRKEARRFLNSAD